MKLVKTLCLMFMVFLSYAEFTRKISSPGNSSQDIYWVDAKIIEDLRPEEL